MPTPRTGHPATDGALGLQLAAKHQPDLILLDLGLPDIAGETLLHNVRSSPHLAQTPIIMLSADAVERQIARVLSAGASAYLAKPLNVRQLLTVLDGLYEPTRRPDEGAEAHL